MRLFFQWKQLQITIVLYHFGKNCNGNAASFRLLTWLSCFTLSLAMEASSCTVDKSLSRSRATGSGRAVDWWRARPHRKHWTDQVEFSPACRINQWPTDVLPCTRLPMHWGFSPGGETSRRLPLRPSGWCWTTRREAPSTSRRCSLSRRKPTAIHSLTVRLNDDKHKIPSLIPLSVSFFCFLPLPLVGTVSLGVAWWLAEAAESTKTWASSTERKRFTFICF